MLATYNTNKTDSDPILESQEVQFLAAHKEKKTYLGLPFYQTDLQGFLAISLAKIESREKENQADQSPLYVLSIDPYRLMWLRSQKKYSHIAQTAFINLPTGAGIPWMSKMLGDSIPAITPLSSYVMNMLRLTEAKGYSVFIIGGNPRASEKLFFNLRYAFPGLLIVGRHHGEMNEKESEQVRLAIKKMNPHIILMDLGQINGLKWMEKYKHEFGRSLVIDMPGEFSSLAGLQKSAPNFFKQHHLTWLWHAVKKPFRLFKVMHWLILIISKKVFP